MATRVVVVDTGPLVTAAGETGGAAELAIAILGRLNRSAWVPDPVAVEADMLLRRRASGTTVARTLWATLDRGVHYRVPMSRELWIRAAEIDQQFADLDLGVVDACVAAVAEAASAQILTWDFRDFRPVAAGLGLDLLVSESDLADL